MPASENDNYYYDNTKMRTHHLSGHLATRPKGMAPVIKYTEHYSVLLWELDEVHQSLLVHLSQKLHPLLVPVVAVLVMEDIEDDQRWKETHKDQRMEKTIACSSKRGTSIIIDIHKDYT